MAPPAKYGFTPVPNRDAYRCSRCSREIGAMHFARYRRGGQRNPFKRHMRRRHPEWTTRLVKVDRILRDALIPGLRAELSGDYDQFARLLSR